MGRWEPGARERLMEAALQLYATRGYEATTAADIAQAVGLTERTFFRHFADKREVIFGGQELFEQLFVDGIAAAPDAAPMDMVASALGAAEEFFPDERRPHSRLRQTIIDAHPGLQERELLKLTAVAASLAEALRRRGVPEPQATLAAESGMTVFGISFRQWLADGEQRSIGDIQRGVLEELRALTHPAGRS
ncbi:TetR family transcriptional regulator [Nakamurella sp. YIM 132087]|uniref:TetR family transcriptional regulator n=1 Tax=Nakamurella alba TaxID=2665158 RepID=A0A7K1FRB0_9ACTN|nr:helix-turn-helix domain-containing protein [Nakamurella alba]MTD15334.1 TetR family transcriptional regulator [Nakamurella alba]